MGVIGFVQTASKADDAFNARMEREAALAAKVCSSVLYVLYVCHLDHISWQPNYCVRMYVWINNVCGFVCWCVISRYSHCKSMKERKKERINEQLPLMFQVAAAKAKKDQGGK